MSKNITFEESNPNFPINLVNALCFDVDAERGNYLQAVEYVLWDVSRTDKDSVQLIRDHYQVGKTVDQIAVCYGKPPEEVAAALEHALSVVKGSPYISMIADANLYASAYQKGYKFGFSVGEKDGLNDLGLNSRHSFYQVTAPDSEVEKLYETAIEELYLSVRSYNCLKRAYLNNIRDLTRTTPDFLYKLRNMGKKSVEEILEKLNDIGFSFHQGEWIYHGCVQRF